MILFFGTRLRRRFVGAGTFGCPYCGTERQYERVRSRTWAHVFWIPLFPLGSEHEALQCTVCHGEWTAATGPDVVGDSPASHA